MASKLLFVSFLGTAMAQTTILNIPFIGYDEFPIQASLVSAAPSATTLALACPPQSECGLFPLQTLTVGPSTYKMDMGVPEGSAVFTGVQDCSIGSASIVCAESFGGSEANFPGSSTETYEATSLGNLKVTVTAGVDKLKNVQAPTTPTPTPTPASTPSGDSSTKSSASQGSSTGGASPASGSTPGTSTPTGAASVNGVVLGGRFVGAAAAVFGGLLL